MIDIHAHLHDSAFDNDRDEVVSRALSLGVTKIITIGTSIEESRKAVACAEKYENVYASVGIHPDFFNEIKKEISNSKLQISNKFQIPNSKIQKEIEELRGLVVHPKVVAIGECGLDYFVREGWKKTETADAPPAGGTTVVSEEQKALQKEGFLVQIELAHELDLPLIIHTRPSVGSMDAYEDVLEILSHSIFEIRNSQFILHCYMGDTEITKKFLTLPNVYFSFTGNITYQVKKIIAGTNGDLTQVVKMIPIERILAETDAPYLAPVPYRGKRNEPAYVVSVVEKIAEIKGISVEETERTIIASAKNIFGVQ